MIAQLKSAAIPKIMLFITKVIVFKQLQEQESMEAQFYLVAYIAVKIGS
jgi:hypothetical protein